MGHWIKREISGTGLSASQVGFGPISWLMSLGFVALKTTYAPMVLVHSYFFKLCFSFKQSFLIIELFILFSSFIHLSLQFPVVFNTEFA